MMATLRDSRQQEKRAAHDYGGFVNPASGAGPYRKNDVRTPYYSIECKVTDRPSFSLKLAELRKAEKHALLDFRTMLWEIRIKGDDFVVMTKAEFLVLDGFRQRHEEADD